MSARINEAAADPAVATYLSTELELPLFVTTVMAARGIDSVEEARALLSPSLDRDWENPYEIDNLEAAVDRIAEAVLADEQILVFGDFDLDGMSATALMTRALRECGATDVRPFIPLRFEEGYGLTQAAIERFLAGGKPALVVTVDNGIAAKREVAALVAQGIDVVITDHHEPADLVPEGVPVVDPKCTQNPSAILAGAGVALKVSQALASRFGKPNLWRELVDLATLGTVADLMPMVGQNRALVAEGVRMINENPRPCLAALREVSGFNREPISASNLSFSLVPRLNAAGRMNNAQLALDLLLSDDYAQATLLAQELESTNTQRRVIESELADVALAQAEDVYRGQRALVVAGEGWHEGVKGIVASRLVGRYGVPTILFTIEGDEAHGSGRSVGDVNLFEAVSSCQDLLVRFGGHHAAVGVTCKKADLPEFTRRLCEYMDTLPPEDFIPRVQVDARVDLSELTLQNVEKLQLLEPFGQENPEPHFLAHGLMMSMVRAVGADKTHLSCTLSDGIHPLSCIMFHCPCIDELLHCTSAVDAVFRLQVDTYRGHRSVKAVVSSIQPLSPCQALEDCLGSGKEFVSGLVDEEAPIAGGCPADALGWVAPEADRALWQQHAQADPAAFRRDLVAAFIGEGTLHDSQRQALEALDRGESALVIMGTGRGKSLIFHIYAAECAFLRGQASLFVYPLRALVADQAFHLQRALGSFGLNVSVLTGASTASERAAVMSALGEGSADIVLTTPEYLECHMGEFAATGRIGFLVVDEAHHIGTSKAGFRPTYTRLAAVREHLGNPQTLALTATANAEAARCIQEDLAIEARIVDDAERANLELVDQRENYRRERYLIALTANAEKTLVYVNSRMETIALTRLLRKREPHIASLIGFYNAGLSRAERQRVEELFRDGRLQVLIATSAFGEGVDIPGIRHVVLWHMPFSEVEFNQMAGRAGRDGQAAQIHLAFNRRDAKQNLALMNDAAPDHDCMAQAYRGLRSLQRAHGAKPFPLVPAEVASHARTLFGAELSERQVLFAVSVFEELGLLETSSAPAGQGEPGPAQAGQSRSSAAETCVYVVDYKGKVELEDSVRYREGIDEKEEFSSFQDWVLKSPANVLQDRIRHPLLP